MTGSGSSTAGLRPHRFQLPLAPMFRYSSQCAVVVVEGATVRIVLAETPP